jgi:hypothetical protein
MHIFTNLYNYFLHSSSIPVLNEVKKVWTILGDLPLS